MEPPLSRPLGLVLGKCGREYCPLLLRRRRKRWGQRKVACDDLTGPGDQMSSNFLPVPLTSEEKVKDESVQKDSPYKVFFRDLFLFKENEMAAKKREKFINHSKKVYQKSTFSSRMKSRSHLGQIAIFTDRAGTSTEKLGLDPTLILRFTDGADAKRTVHEFINDQRDRFLLEFALSTKRNTIQKYEKHTTMKERQLMKAEKKLQEDAMAFEEFLRENDQRSVDALKMAAQETINKLQMTAELKKASMEIQAVKSEIAKTEFLLREYMKYGFFLLKLSPKQWQIQQAMKRVSKSKENVNAMLPSIITKLSARRKEGSMEESRGTSFSEDSSLGRGSQGKPRKRTTLTLENKKSSLSNRAESISSEDSLDFLLDDDMDYDLEKLIDSLSKKINQVYRVCIGDAEVGSLNPIQKLVKVESRLVELSDLIESIPKENVEAIERMKQKERRQKLREEKMREKQKHQEERLKAALERAVAQPKKKLGRRLIYRSKPPSANKHELFSVKDTKTKSLEEEYFFT
ncbi:coiled-coil domain-containing protein 38 isoform X3 [Sus scrofa]|uniref:coiled-coil domain-containing protein 38 isoform X3 n=1 Tax=Sus scrofa TaxID=9823 RepID=UPI000A2B8718|nr:coiled-coil domain-containing protein 38 isoform X3 [Sus scrofa]